MRIKHHGFWTYNILLHEDHSCLFVANFEGRLVQYSLDFQGHLGRVIKDYGDLKLGWISSSLWLGDVLVFGGSKNNLAFIHIQNRCNLGNNFQVAPKFIHSIDLGWVRQHQSPSKAFLIVAGQHYDSLKTDFFDITRFLSNSQNAHPINLQQNTNSSSSKSSKISESTALEIPTNHT